MKNKTSDKVKFTSIEEYISNWPENIQEILRKLQGTIKRAAPKAEELISYNMPAFQFHGILVWYAAYKKHIGFYPRGSGIESFKSELAGYKTSKGAVQFPIDRPLPLNLIAKIVKFRVKENLEKVHRPKEFLPMLSAPARRALENKRIKSLLMLSKFTEKEILALHGMGPGSIPKLRKALNEEGLSFRK